MEVKNATNLCLDFGAKQYKLFVIFFKLFFLGGTLLK
ncbi:hypothetical protein FLAN108750_07510 [Flavobacterium antarcticum]